MRTLSTVLLLAGAAYAALLAYVYFFQSRLIYFPGTPGRELITTPAEIGLTYQEVRLTAADGVQLHGWFVPAAPDAPAVLICHGNAGNISHRLQQIQLFNGLGLSVLLFDYRGYGRSEGSPSEQGTYLDARAAWEHLAQVRRIAPERIVIFGESLGGPIAAELASSVGPAALILASTFTSAPDLGSAVYPFLPVRLLARYQYPTARFVAAARAPLMVIHSRGDEIVPFRHAEALMRAGHEPKRLLEIPGDHNSGFFLGEAQLAAGLRQFLDTYVRAGN